MSPDNYKTHFILFLEYLSISKMIANLKEIDYDNKEIHEIAEYVFECMPYKESLVNVEYFSDASEMMRYMNMSPEELEQEKQKLLNKTGLWSL